LKRKRPRPHLNWRDRLFWVALRSLWTRWRDAAADVREAIERMIKENLTWGAPRIHGELLKLGFDVSERTVSRYLARRKPGSEDARKKWAAFLKNHREAIAAMDFFTVPTLTFRLLYCFFVVAHDRRKILHFNVTAHPTAEWVCQQLREAFPNPPGPYKYVIMDRDPKFNVDVVNVLAVSGIPVVRTSVRTPQQNGIAERWVETARRDCFDHVIALSEAHVRRLGRDLVAYYHEDRTHMSLEKDTPHTRPAEPKPIAARLESLPRIGGLHHRYFWKAAA
jgi:transposase InsO family protein